MMGAVRIKVLALLGAQLLPWLPGGRYTTNDAVVTAHVCTNRGDDMYTRRHALKTAAGLGVVASVAGCASTQTAPGARALVETVRGRVAASELGFTLPHEHIYASSPGFLRAWPEFFGGREALRDKAVAGLRAAKSAGVQTIVDVTTFDIGRDVRLMAEISRAADVHIVAATGLWIDPSLSMRSRSVEELTQFFLREIEQGIEDTRIKAGIIKVATEGATTPFQELVLKAAARASLASGVPVTTHTLAAQRDGERQAAILESEGLSPSRVCIGHSDDSDDLDYLTGLAARGYALGVDHITRGVRGPDPDEQSSSSHSAPRGSWRSRLHLVKALIDRGFADRILLSNDWLFGFSNYGTASLDALDRRNPDGMTFISNRALPFLLDIGVSRETLSAMTVANPARLLIRA